MSAVAPDEFARAARFLAESADYRVLRRLRPVRRFHQADPGAPLRIGVVLDVETTGLDAQSDKIIELAIQRFRYDAAGHIVEVGQPRVWREDPGFPLDPRITALTGLTDAVLKDQAIDEAMALELLASADLVIAHNARFDRPFVDKRLPAAAGKAWACSMAELDWLALGFDGRALAHLVAQCGWFYEGHRAENDILALLTLLAHRLDDDSTILSHLLAASARDSFRVNAVDAPFEAKDRLKARAYRWNATLRFWTRDISADEAEAERLWLRQEVYAGHGAAAFQPLTAIERYR
ncbi:MULTISPECIES: 3'-5' exonuclease [unclassified Novosphingobium]|uniref:3'-5' exonuclease n=1 Tax=unclassified Novosphingobium TaxID=2644732 RepID=UPI00146C5868|nr:MULTISPECIES: 3'-5' exonuclease [unclassified Novosphingobium]NMN06607.1 DNA polymerase-3 subunit epsilon [Novosphingobium sp. SG919]NMN88942.1 DNA polymerase-3 subunit epsilon [Novosphingobium sp. SG916]